MSSSTFDNLNLIGPLRKVLNEEGYEIPTPIQVDTIPHILEGRDIIGCAQTGTGKTAAFALPIIQLLSERKTRPKPKNAKVLVLTPTRELAAQIGESFRTYGKYMNQSQSIVFGGVGQGKQVREMSRGVHELIATPGRLLDLMNQGHIKLDKIEIFVLDEADRMLDMGFIKDIKKIIAHLPKKRQSLFFSATMSKEIIKLSNSILTNPFEVSVTPESPTVELIDQQLMYIDTDKKPQLLIKILSGHDAKKTLVFTRTKRSADKVVKLLTQANIAAKSIHGDKSQTARTLALKKFKTGRTKVLVATDIAARGIDVDEISHVINYEIPDDAENYVHRIGRTARAGASGIAISFCAAQERENLRSVEKYIKQEIPVVEDQPFHSVNAQTATGKQAKRQPRSQTRRQQYRGKSGKPQRGSARKGGEGKSSSGKSSEGKGGEGKGGEGKSKPWGKKGKKRKPWQTKEGKDKDGKSKPSESKTFSSGPKRKFRPKKFNTSKRNQHGRN